MGHGGRTLPARHDVAPASKPAMKVFKFMVTNTFGGRKRNGSQE
jgi:hypothetical protein